VVAIEFEYSPSRGTARYTSDGSAFDVFLECRTPEGKRAFAGVEVKYHEDLANKPAGSRDRYDEIAGMMGCFRPDDLAKLRRAPLQQLWRDHLLCGAMRTTDGYDDGIFVVLHPKDNKKCCDAVTAYRKALSDSSSFDAWLLEDVLKFLSMNTTAEWPHLVFDRYCDFAKLIRATTNPSTV
jgi:hypothetical protein